MNLHLTVTESEAEILGKALQQMPFGVVRELFQKLQLQIAQQQANAAQPDVAGHVHG
jgi:hypothetical protein